MYGRGQAERDEETGRLGRMKPSAAQSLPGVKIRIPFNEHPDTFYLLHRFRFSRAQHTRLRSIQQPGFFFVEMGFSASGGWKAQQIEVRLLFGRIRSPPAFWPDQRPGPGSEPAGRHRYGVRSTRPLPRNRSRPTSCCPQTRASGSCLP